MKYIFILFLTLSGNAPIFSQLKGAIPQSNVPSHINDERTVENSTPALEARNSADKLTKVLQLNEEQNKNLYSALLDYETNVAKTNKSKLSKKEKYQKIGELNRSKQQKLKQILTKQQYNAYLLSFP
ncbi:MAG: hypothetical protein WBO36_11485 [Saprospiraceae bacterium]